MPPSSDSGNQPGGSGWNRRSASLITPSPVKRKQKRSDESLKGRCQGHAEAAARDPLYRRIRERLQLAYDQLDDVCAEGVQSQPSFRH